jgi:ubiquitin C-terminal hydrolase
LNLLLETVNRGIIFWSLPQILIIDLKRWHGHTRKNHIKVEAPIHNADFSKYVKGYNSASYIYDLYGVCNHMGDVGGGHYTAYIKNANNKWYEFNDTNVREIPEQAVVSPQSYCFFYRKIGV